MTNTTTEKRVIGPVTTATTGGVALSGIICWAVEEFAHVQVPSDVQGYAAVLFCIIAGYLVTAPRHDKGRYSA